MDFESADPSVVKSVKQLDFLNTWLRLHARRDCMAPVLAEYEPDRIEDEKADLVFYRIEWSQERPRIRINSEGSRVADAYGKAGQGRGRYLDEYLGPDAAPDVLPVYHECIRRVRPVYTVSTIDDVHGRRVVYERLLLPFSDGTALTDIIASLKTISDEGRFEIRDLLRSVDRKPEFKLRAVIDRGPARRPAPARNSADDVVEV